MLKNSKKDHQQYLDFCPQTFDEITSKIRFLDLDRIDLTGEWCNRKQIKISAKIKKNSNIC